MSEPCPKVEELSAMLEDAPDLEWVERHVATCSLCQRILDVLTREPGEGTIGGIVPSFGAAAMSGKFLDRLARNPPGIGPTLLEHGETLLESGASAEGGPEDVPRIPHYEILDELGRGGMGVVYRAQEVRLKRVVALKMLLPDASTSAELVARFRSEAETVARVRHRNVVGIHAVGLHEGRPFIEMEFVDGGSLSARLDGTPWPPREAASLVEALARGVEEVHRLGVIHRDLKPGNVLMAPGGIPKIGDFGLAKILEEDSHITRTGTVMGTPSYMAPEQADPSGGSVGPSADIYALGAIYYELLTGRPPFKAASVLETLRQVKSDDPVVPSRLVPGLPRDAETIALKCLEKSPARRYESAGALAEDLRRSLDGRPILARPLGPTGRLLRLCRRNPGMTGLAAMVVLLLLAITGISLTAALRLTAAATLERRTRYFSDMNLTQQAWEANDTLRMRDLLLPYARSGGREDLRGFEWGYWWRLGHLYKSEFRGHADHVEVVAFSPDGAKVVSVDRQLVMLLWDRASLRVEARVRVPVTIRVLGFSPDGRTIAAGGEDGYLAIWEPGRGAPEALEGARERVMALAFVGAGRLMSAHESNLVRTWDLASKKTIRTVAGPQLPAGKISARDYPVPHAFARDGRSLAVAGPDGTILVRPTDSSNPSDAVTLKLEGPSRGPGGGGAQALDLPGRSLAFSPDGALLAVGGEDFTATVWDIAARRELARLRGHAAPIWSLAFSPDGKQLATSSFDNTVMLWDVASGRLEAHLKGHGGPIRDVTIAAEGGYLATASEDGTVKIWGLGQRDSNVPLGGHGGGVNDVAYYDYPEGPVVAVASRDGRITIWAATTGRRLASVLAQRAGRDDGQSHLRALAYSRDGRFLFSGGFDGPVRIWDSRTLDLEGELTTDRPSPSYEDLVVSPDGTLLVAAARGSRVELWDLRGRTHLVSFDCQTRALAFSPDGTTLAVADGDRISLIDLEESLGTGRLQRKADHRGGRFECLAFSPDGSILAAGGEDGSILRWDLASGRPGAIASWHAHSNRLTSLMFSPDGRTLFSGGRDNTIRLWDAADRELKTTLKGHTRNIMSLAFSRDGRTLVSGSLDGTARLWFAPDPDGVARAK